MDIRDKVAVEFLPQLRSIAGDRRGRFERLTWVAQSGYERMWLWLICIRLGKRRLAMPCLQSRR